MQNSDTNHLLLLGAGFSRNWGGWLATEADEYLLGHPSIDKSIRDVLWHHRRKGGFESALAQLQQEERAGERLARLQEAISQMFSDMDRAFEGINFNFNNSRKDSVSFFLTRFDAIFTLNQDLLLERHYFGNDVSLTSNGKWSGHTLPGLKKNNSEPDTWGGIGKWEPSESTFAISSQNQPYFKLHGSANWQVSGSNQLLVMGGNKSGLISKYPLLQQYHNEFRDRLSRPNTRLMIIGYTLTQFAASNGASTHFLDQNEFLVQQLG
jgi:hypothetical protein